MIQFKNAILKQLIKHYLDKIYQLELNLNRYKLLLKETEDRLNNLKIK